MKRRSMVNNRQMMRIEVNVDVKTTDGYLLRVLCIGFIMNKDQSSKRKTCHAQHTQVKAIRKKMVNIITADVVQNDFKEVFSKLHADSIAKDIERKTQRIYPLHDVFIRKMKILILRRPTRYDDIVQKLLYWSNIIYK